MSFLALKMLIGNRASFFGIIFGIFLATLLISQQSAIFLGLLSRSYRMVTDIGAPTIWVMDPATESDERVRRMPRRYLDVVRGVSGVAWAVPINSASLPLVAPGGYFQIAQLYGIDDATLLGAPPELVVGNLGDLRREGSIVLDAYSAQGLLAKPLPDGTRKPVEVGDELEINQRRATVVGLCKVTQGFYPQPIIFTTNQSLRSFQRQVDSGLSFIAAINSPDTPVQVAADRIEQHSGLTALTSEQFRQKIADYFLRTGILINFGLSVALGIIIGFSIAGQIFYLVTLENLKYYALIKAIGGTQRMIIGMIVLQTVVVGSIGFALGTIVTFLWGLAIRDTVLAFLFPWQLLLFTGGIVFFICLCTAAFSIRKVLSVDPKILLGN